MLLSIAIISTLIIILLTISTVIIIFILLMRDSIINSVPFVPIRKRAINNIIELLQLSNQSTFYDLGCGDGRVLIAAIKEQSGINSIGVENGIIPFLISKIRTYKSPFKLIFSNFFYVDISDATHIFCYLSNPILKELAPKILRECKKGTRIVTCDFCFPNWKPLEIRPIDIPRDPLSRTLYVYRV